MNNRIKSIIGACVALTLAMPMLTSCFDDSELWEAIDQLELRVDSLQNGLNAQIEAMSALMTENLMIDECVMNTDSSYLVTLSNGMKFTVLPGNASAQTLVSCVVVNGKLCWATYDANGVLTPLTDAKGAAIPVDAGINVQIKDGKYYLVVNGKEYLTGFDTEDMVSVFSSCEAHKDASGQVYAMTFNFGNGVEVTVAVDGYKGVLFKFNNAGNSSVVTEYFVNYSEEVSLIMDMEGVVDYVMQIPDGWRVEERYNNYTGETFVDIKAPTEVLVEGGAAVSTGDLKVVAVVEGGKAVVSKLRLSALPFKEFQISSTKALVEPYFGVHKYVYGICLTDDFDKITLLNDVMSFITTNQELPVGVGISEEGINLALADIYGSELNPEYSYTFWAIPALYSDGTGDKETGFYALENMFYTYELSPITVILNVTESLLYDANISVEVKGTDKMYAGTALMTEDLLEEVVYKINEGIVEPVDKNLVYQGKASVFPSAGVNAGVEFLPASKYVTWVVPVEEGKKEYSVNDVFAAEFDTHVITSGGSLALIAKDAEVTKTSVNIPLVCEDAEMIYYTYLGAEGITYQNWPDNELVEDLIFPSENCVFTKGQAIDALIEKVRPNSSVYLFAVAVDAEGKYGTVYKSSATTEKMQYNSLEVSVAEVEVKAKNATFKVSVSGGTPTELLYWVGKTTDKFWAIDMGGSVATAQEYMGLYPDDPKIAACMSEHGEIKLDENFTINGLELGSEYAVVVIAKDDSGLYSKAGSKIVQTLEADLGNMVLSSTEKWKTTKSTIEKSIVWHKDLFSAGGRSGQGFSNFAFDINIPTDLTAFIACFTPKATTSEAVIIELEAYCSQDRPVSIAVKDENGESPTKPDWIDDAGKFHAGSLLNVSDMYVHGVPHLGYATYISSQGHDATTCSAWEAGECSNYQHLKQTIANYLSFDYWRDYVIRNCNYAHMGDPTHEYSYALTDPDKINDLAQAYVEAYTPYYSDREPIIYINNGDALRMSNPTASGLDENGDVVDIVVVILKDNDGNYYEPMYIDVPNYYK